ncbi:MAG: hypothetical protein F4Y63_08605 [Chloroflexi bacterium]|nr:hypothetical protein [Chloroflexota bacterium]
MIDKQTLTEYLDISSILTGRGQRLAESSQVIGASLTGLRGVARRILVRSFERDTHVTLWRIAPKTAGCRPMSAT